MTNTALDDAVLVPPAMDRRRSSRLRLFQITSSAFRSARSRTIAQLEAPGPSSGQELLDRLAVMDGRAIPDHQELAGEMAQQVAQEAHLLFAMERCPLHHLDELAVGGEAADRRETLMAQRDAEYRGLAEGGGGCAAGRPSACLAEGG